MSAETKEESPISPPEAEPTELGEFALREFFATEWSDVAFGD